MEEKVAPEDVGFLNAETRELTQHIGGVMILRPPSALQGNFARQLIAWLQDFPVNRSPFNQIASEAARGLSRRNARRSLVWRTLPPEEIRLGDHLKLWALPPPGGKRELAELVARLHEPLLDRAKPLWEYNIIDGLEGGRIAIYMKLHHSLMDGMAGVSMWDMAQNPKEMDVPPMWHSASPAQKRAKARARPIYDRIERYKSAVTSAKAAPDFANYVRDLAAPAIKGTSEGLYGPFMAPRTMLNGAVTSRRSFGMASVPFAGCRAIAKAKGATVNDVFVALCGGALRAYLSAHGDLPADAPLVATIPVAIERKGDARNAATGLFATLGTNIADPIERLEAVRHSTAAAKERLRDLNPDAVQLYAAMTLAGMPMLAKGGKLLEKRAKQAMSLAVSSLPGPPLSYLRGAELEAVYATSLLAVGTALNVTILTYAGQATFGLIACPDPLPAVEEIALGIEKAYQELEAAVLGDEGGAASGASPERPVAAAKKRTSTRKASAGEDAVEPAAATAYAASEKAAASANKVGGARKLKSPSASAVITPAGPKSTSSAPKARRTGARAKAAD